MNIDEIYEGLLITILKINKSTKTLWQWLILHRQHLKISKATFHLLSKQLIIRQMHFHLNLKIKMIFHPCIIQYIKSCITVLGKYESLMLLALCGMYKMIDIIFWHTQVSTYSVCLEVCACEAGGYGQYLLHRCGLLDLLLPGPTLQPEPPLFGQIDTVNQADRQPDFPLCLSPSLSFSVYLTFSPSYYLKKREHNK